MPRRLSKLVGAPTIPTACQRCGHDERGHPHPTIWRWCQGAMVLIVDGNPAPCAQCDCAVFRPYLPDGVELIEWARWIKRGWRGV